MYKFYIRCAVFFSRILPENPRPTDGVRMCESGQVTLLGDREGSALRSGALGARHP